MWFQEIACCSDACDAFVRPIVKRAMFCSAHVTLFVVWVLHVLLQVHTYLQWVRWIIFEALHGRSYVFMNMDETTISQLHSTNQGFLPSRRVQRDQGMIRRKRKPDRHDVRTCLLGAVCSDPSLQPHLPQVVLPSSSKHVRPPEEALKEYRNTGAH